MLCYIYRRQVRVLAFAGCMGMLDPSKYLGANRWKRFQAHTADDDCQRIPSDAEAAQHATTQEAILRTLRARPRTPNACLASRLTS